MSHTNTRRLNTGSACSTPRWMRRASSVPEMTSTSTPASSRARWRKASWLPASRTAEVATARTGAPDASAMRRMRARAATPRSMASGASSFMSPPPRPRRTISFSCVRTSKARSPSTRATTRWNELVPTSMAASVSAPSVGRSGAAGERGGERRAVGTRRGYPGPPAGQSFAASACSSLISDCCPATTE